MPLPVIINSIVCIVGTVIGVLFAGASLISIANMNVSWVGFLIVAALLVPIMFVVSGIGLWLAYGWPMIGHPSRSSLAWFRYRGSMA